MARKRSVSGRKRPVTPQSKLILEIERANKKLNRLEKGGVYGRYASKELLRMVANNQTFSYRRGRKNKIRVSKMPTNTADTRLLLKQVGKFLKSATSSVLGIFSVRKTAQRKLKKTLGGLMNRKISNEEVDEFYEMVNDPNFKYIADKIGDSETYVLVQNITENNLSKDDFVKQFNQFFDESNNFDVKWRAQKLFDKFIKLKYGEVDYNAVFVGQFAGGIENLDAAVQKAKEQNMDANEFYFEILKFKEPSIQQAFGGAPEGRYSDKEIGETYYKIRDFYDKYVKE